MAIAFVDAVAKNGGGASAAIDTTTADFLVAVVSSWPTVGSLTDSQSNTWTGLTSQTVNSYHAKLFYVASPTTNASHTFAGVGGFPGIVVAAFSGVAASPFDQESGTAVSASSGQPGSLTPSADNALVISAIGFEPASFSSVDGGFSVAGTAVNTGSVGATLAYLIQGTAAAANPTFTISASANLVLVQATFLAAGAAAVPRSFGVILG